MRTRNGATPSMPSASPGWTRRASKARPLESVTSIQDGAEVRSWMAPSGEAAPAVTAPVAAGPAATGFMTGSATEDSGADVAPGTGAACSDAGAAVMGDVPVVRLDTDRILSTGWRCGHTTRDALRLTMQSMLADLADAPQ